MKLIFENPFLIFSKKNYSFNDFLEALYKIVRNPNIVSLSLSLMCFFLILYYIFFFDNNFEMFQFVKILTVFSSCFTYFSKIISCFFTINFSFFSNFFLIPVGFDGISILLVLLTTFITPLCLFSIFWFNSSEKRFFYYFLYIVLEFCIIISFVSLDMLSFYLFFEFTLLPMFLIISTGGSRFRKIKASFFSFFYTLLGSITMLVCLFIITIYAGNTLFDDIFLYRFTLDSEKMIWMLLFITFSIKIPTLPFHTWLTEAHVEAPTSGSIILASILLKLGAYGFIRYALPLSPNGFIFFMPLTFMICLVSTVYSSLNSIRQVDLKRMIAYSSIAHMNFALLGLFTLSLVGVCGSFYLFPGHGLVSAALFFNVGVLYDRYHTRLIFYYGGLTSVMPLFSSFFIFFLFPNAGFPSTVNFLSEFFILNSLAFFSWFVLIVSSIASITPIIYNIWTYNRVMLGNLKTTFISKYSDLNLHELVINLNLTVINFILGLETNFIFDISVNSLSLFSK